MASCHPQDYSCRISSGELQKPPAPPASNPVGTGTNTGFQFAPAGGTTSANSAASQWWKIIVGVFLLAIIIDLQPKVGGWLLLLIMIGLAFFKQGMAIIKGS